MRPSFVSCAIPSLRRLSLASTTPLGSAAPYRQFSDNTVYAPAPRLTTSTGVTGGSTFPDSQTNNTASSSATSTNRHNPRPKHTEYFNFATRDEFLRRHGGATNRSRRSRARAFGPAEEEQLLRANLKSRDEANLQTAAPIFRKEIAVFSGYSNKGTQPQVSLDVTAKRFLDMFCDFETKRCKLCNETFVQWHLHASGIPHTGREGILLELVRPFCGTPEEQVLRWTQRLVNCTAFGRIPALSHMNSQIRKRRLQYLLKYLKDRNVLTDVFNLNNNANNDAGRTFEFERLEFIGDGVVKYILNNVLHIVFPVVEGGSRGRLSNFQFVMDGNEGLARGYDFLELQDLTLSTRVVSKFKSDVVETLFGELQFYLWMTELDVNTEPVTFPFTQDNYTLRAIVQHVVYETATVLFLYHVEHVLSMLQRVAREEQLQLVRADPSLLHMQPRNGAVFTHRQARSFFADDDDGLSGDDDGYYGGGGGGSRRGGGGDSGVVTVAAPTKKLMKVRVARAHLHGGSAATFHESTNYDSFKRVVPIGGLLPRAFAREQLAVIPNYMPHIQRDEAMTQQLRKVEGKWLIQLDKKLAETAATEPEVFHLSSTPATKEKGRAAQELPLSVPRLKDEGLIAELI